MPPLKKTTRPPPQADAAADLSADHAHCGHDRRSEGALGSFSQPWSTRSPEGDGLLCTAMVRLRPYPIAALVAWTLFTWVSRIGLVWSDEGQSTAAKMLAMAPVLVFVVLASAVGALMLADRRFSRLAWALAGWTIGYWVLRLPWILVHDHPVPFKVVHTLLAVVAVGLAVAALRALSARRGASLPTGQSTGPSSSAPRRAPA